MKNNNEEIDQIIKDSLTQEEAKFYEELEEQNLLNKIGGVFKGKVGWLVIIMNILSLIALGFFIYCTVEFFNTDSTNELIKWGAGAIYSVLFICMIKIYFWQAMHKNDMLREMKRLELQIAALAGKN